MSDNSGAKDHCDSPVSETFLRWPFQVSSGGQTRADTLIPEVAGYRNPGPTANLRGIEANTNESKGVPYTLPGVTGGTHPEGKSSSIDECT